MQLVIERRKWHSCSISLWPVLCSVAIVLLSLERSVSLTDSAITGQITSSLRDGSLSPFVINSGNANSAAQCNHSS